MHRFWRDHRYAAFKRRHAQALLQNGFGFGKLYLRVDAAHVILRGFDRHSRQAHTAGNDYGVAEIVFAFGICIADTIDDGERLLAVQRNQAAIAETDLALFCRWVALFTDGEKFVSAHQESSVARRIGWLEAENCHGRTIG